uniref:SCP domain-containing protein n=1 Tax=Alexandrium catenella TaxID=2925 RepID=A0A7S1WR39_ALECA
MAVTLEGLEGPAGPDGMLAQAAIQRGAASLAAPPARKSLGRRLAVRFFAVAALAVCVVLLMYFLLRRHIGESSGEYDLGDFQEISRKVFDRTNAYRASEGLPSLEWSDGIAAIAAEHASKMASGEARFSHQGFAQRAASFPVAHSSAGENLAACRGSAPQQVANCTVDGWIQSRTHEENLVGRFDLCGVGTARSREGAFFLAQLLAARL